MAHPNYPSPQEIDSWTETILSRAAAAEREPRRLDGERYPFSLGIRGISCGEAFLSFPSVAPLEGVTDFHCFWQPAPAGPAPILFHVPGYGAEMSAHPELVAAGFNVLHINPLGYATPKGPCADVPIWPVLFDTVRSFGEKGYIDWLTDAAIAVRWALRQPSVQANRFGFFGTSQGGGGSLLLASIFSKEGCRAVAADEPFLVNFPLLQERDNKTAFANFAIATARDMPKEDQAKAWKAIGYCDPINHARRLTMPTLLTCGTEDGVCPDFTIESLFEMLPGTRSLTSLSGEGHGYTMPFHHLTAAWARIYV